MCPTFFTCVIFLKNYFQSTIFHHIFQSCNLLILGYSPCTEQSRISCFQALNTLKQLEILGLCPWTPPGVSHNQALHHAHSHQLVAPWIPEQWIPVDHNGSQPYCTPVPWTQARCHMDLTTVPHAPQCHIVTHGSHGTHILSHELHCLLS